MWHISRSNPESVNVDPEVKQLLGCYWNGLESGEITLGKCCIFYSFAEQLVLSGCDIVKLLL